MSEIPSCVEDDPPHEFGVIVRPDSILNRTQNFLELYHHMVGKSETPIQWHHWSALSILSASVMNRVWVETYDKRKIKPNMYIFLYGESGGGKSTAIGEATELAHEAGLPDLFNGRVTREAVLDWMGTWKVDSQGQRIPPNPNIYLIQDELAAALRTSEHGMNFLTMMTELYSRPNLPWRDATRGGGVVTIQNPCANWLAGSTPRWVQDVVPKSALEGGLLARIMWIWGEKDYSKKYPVLQYPPDRAIVKQALMKRLAGYTWMEGIFKMTPLAESHRVQWYLNLPVDPEEYQKSMLNRADGIVQRLSLLYAMADIIVEPGKSNTGPWTIEARHLQMAIESWQWAYAMTPHVASMSKQDAGQEKLEEVRKQLRKGGRMAHSVLLKRVSPRGVRAKELKEIIETLKEQQEVRIEVEENEAGREGLWYRWIEQQQFPFLLKQEDAYADDGAA